MTSIKLAKINNVDCNFKACSAADMELDETYDVIIGFAVLSIFTFIIVLK